MKNAVFWDVALCRSLCHHYRTLHKDIFGALEVKRREDKLQNLKSDV
jgi:hypothetical protein